MGDLDFQTDRFYMLDILNSITQSTSVFMLCNQIHSRCRRSITHYVTLYCGGLDVLPEGAEITDCLTATPPPLPAGTHLHITSDIKADFLMIFT